MKPETRIDIPAALILSPTIRLAARGKNLRGKKKGLWRRRGGEEEEVG